jgi:hypothetical protein
MKTNPQSAWLNAPLSWKAYPTWKWTPQTTVRCLSVCLMSSYVFFCMVVSTQQWWDMSVNRFFSLSLSLSLLNSPNPISVIHSLTWVFSEIQVLNVHTRYPPKISYFFSSFFLLHCLFYFFCITLCFFLGFIWSNFFYSNKLKFNYFL